MRFVRNDLLQCQWLVQLLMLIHVLIVGHSLLIKTHFCLLICDIFVTMVLMLLLFYRCYQTCPCQIRHFSVKTKKTFVENINISFSFLLLCFRFSAALLYCVGFRMKSQINVNDFQFIFLFVLLIFFCLLPRISSKITSHEWKEPKFFHLISFVAVLLRMHAYTRTQFNFCVESNLELVRYTSKQGHNFILRCKNKINDYDDGNSRDKNNTKKFK